MAVASSENKALVASSEFDPSAFIKGIDAMTAALVKLSAEEDKIRTDLKNLDTAMKANRAEYKINTDQITALDKTSKTYVTDLQKLTAEQTNLKNQQKELRASFATNKDALTAINQSANEYKAALVGINAVSKQVEQENHGRTLFDVASLNQQVQQVTELGGKLRNVFQGKISTAELDRFEQELSQTTDEFKQLDQVITFVKSKLDTLDPNSQEFADLNQIVETGEQVLEQYGQTVQNTDKKAVSLRSQLRAMREELARLEDQGLDNTKEFQDLQVAAGKLQDQIGDTQQRIKVLSSDTKNLDFGIAAIRGVASAFGLAQGAAALFGIENEDVLKSIQRLNAIMLILNGLQELSTLLKKQEVLAIVGQDLATRALTATQRIYAVAVGTSTGALRGFRVALLATGIGAAVVAIGFLVAKFLEARKAVDQTAKNYKLLNDVVKEGNVEAGKQISSLKLLTQAARDINLPLEERLKAVQELQKEFPDYFGNLSKEAILTGDITKETDALTISIQKAARARAAKGKIDAIEAERLDLDFEREQTRADIQKNLLDKQVVDRKDSRDKEARGLDQFANHVKELDLQQKVRQQQSRDDELKRQVEFLTKFVGIDQLAKVIEDPAKAAKEKTVKAVKEIQNEFARKKAELDQQLAEATRKEADDESKIRVEFAARLQKEQLDIEKLLKEKKLTKPQAKILSDEAIEINTAQLDTALKDFNKRVTDSRQKLNEDIRALQEKATLDTLNLIQDEFNKRAALIDFNEKNEIEKAEATNQKRLDALNLYRLLIGERAFQDAKKIIVATGEQNILNIIAEFGQQRQNLANDISARIFENAQQDVERIFTGASLIVSQVTTAEILKLAARYQQGKITYEKFQKELTKITEDESTKRIAQNIREQEELLKLAQKELAAEKDPGRQKVLQDKIVALQLQIEELKRQLALADATGTNKGNQELAGRIEELAKYAAAVGNIVSSVVSFWQQANEAEQRSLERSIALQERRVDAATRIAERGNSEYLRLEEDRLQELQAKQENAARRQLAINAVLQTSQALTAFISALAQGIALGGPLGGIAIAGAVIAAIGAGYSIIQSLQPETQKLKGGTKSVKRKGEPAGVDTVPAMLTEGEGVLPVDINREYKPTVEAIFDKKIPAEVINKFVNNYPKKEISTMVNNYHTNQRILPRLDHERMSEVAEVKVVYDSQLLNATKEQTRKIDENNDRLERVEKALRGMGVQVNLDKDGLGIILMKAVDQRKIDKMT